MDDIKNVVVIAIGKAEPFARAFPEAQKVITKRNTRPINPKIPDST
jgi:hypothetical protein